VSECELHLIIGCAHCYPVAEPATIRFLDGAARSGDGDRLRWTAVEVEYAKDVSLTNGDVAALTGRSRNAIRMYRLANGIVDKAYDRTIDQTAARSMARWTEAELETLNSTAHLSIEEVAKMIGRTASAVGKARYRAGIGGGASELAKAVYALTQPRVVLNPDVAVPYAAQKIISMPLLVELDWAISGTLGRDAASKVASAFERNILDSDALFEFMKITSSISSWCRLVGVTPTKVPVDDLDSWHGAFTGRSSDGYLSQLQEWERIILAKLDPVRTVEITDACPVCESSAWQDADGVWHPRPVVVQYRRSNPKGTAGGWCRVESCEAVWADLDAIRLLRAQIGSDPAVLLAFLHN